MKKISIKQFLCAASVFALFFCVNSPSEAYCNSPCPNPCSSSRTICEGTNCTTYCDADAAFRYGVSYYNSPAVSFSYSTPRISFSVSNEVYGVHNYYSRPNFVITNGFRPVYHKAPPKPAPSNNKPAPKPAPNKPHR